MRGLVALFCALSFLGSVASPVLSPAVAQESAPLPTATPDPKTPIKITLASPLATLEKPLKVQASWGKWLPVQVTLSNTGDPVSGQLRLRLFNDSDQAVRASEAYTDIELPTTSNKQFWLFGRMERGDLNVGEITFSGRGFRSVTVPFGIDSRDVGTRIVLSVSANGEKMNGLLGVKKPFELGIIKEITSYRRDMGQGNAPWTSDLVRPLSVTHKNLPSRWNGLQAADAVILQDFPFAELSEAQLNALRGYTAAGGALVVVGGANWDRLAKSPLADLLPVTPTGAQPANNQQRAAYARRYIEPNLRDLKQVQLGDDLAGAPLMLTQSQLRPGAKALWGSSSPVIAVRHYGAGQVVFLACDPTAPPFLGWRGVPYFWKEIFENTAPPTGIDGIHPSLNGFYGNINPYMGGNFSGNMGNEGNTPTAALLEELRRVKQLKTPPVSTIAWFLALYVFFLVPVNYCLLRLFDKRELAWVTVPIIVVVFSVMSYAAALRIKGSTLLARQVNIVQGSGALNFVPVGDQLARSDNMMWLFSPRKTAYTVQGSEAALAIADYLKSQEDLNGRVTLAQESDDKPFRVEDAAVNMWAERSFVGHSVLNLKGGVQVQTASGKPVVKNATPFDMRGVVVKWDRTLWACGNIKSGATVTSIKLNRSDATGAQLSGVISTSSSLKEIFPDGGTSMRPPALSALNLALGSPAGESGALVTGWSVQPASGLTVADSSPAQENATLFLFDLE